MGQHDADPVRSTTQQEHKDSSDHGPSHEHSGEAATGATTATHSGDGNPVEADEPDESDHLPPTPVEPTTTTSPEVALPPPLPPVILPTG